MSPYEEGFRIGVAGGRRSDNPYAKGWSRIAALVMPGSLAEEWDMGFMRGLKYRSSLERMSDHG
jgi:hypothetical protein